MSATPASPSRKSPCFAFLSLAFASSPLSPASLDSLASAAQELLYLPTSYQPGCDTGIIIYSLVRRYTTYMSTLLNLRPFLPKSEKELLTDLAVEAFVGPQAEAMGVNQWRKVLIVQLEQAAEHPQLNDRPRKPSFCAAVQVTSWWRKRLGLRRHKATESDGLSLAEEGEKSTGRRTKGGPERRMMQKDDRVESHGIVTEEDAEFRKLWIGNKIEKFAKRKGRPVGKLDRNGTCY